MTMNDADADADDPLSFLIDGSVDDAVFRALRERERRLVVYFLLDRERTDLSELADVVTGWTAAGGPGTATSEDRARVRVALHHRHLPVLEAAGLLAYDVDAGTVALEPLSDRVRSLLEWARAFESDRDREHR